MKKITVGLCRGRHEMPVTEYIFESIEDVTDTVALEKVATEFFAPRLTKVRTASCLHQASYEDAVYWTVAEKPVIYVTGLTAALIATIAAAVSKPPLTRFQNKTDKGVQGNEQNDNGLRRIRSGQADERRAY